MHENELYIHVRGDAFIMALRVQGLDFTGKTVKSMFKRTKNQDTPDLTFLSTDSSIDVDIISTTETILTLTKPVAEINALENAIYTYDVQVYTTAEDVYTFCKGKVKIVNEITT